MNTKITIGFDAKRIVRNASGLGMYSRTLVNNIIRCNNSGDEDGLCGQMQLLLYAPDKGRDDLRRQMVLDEHTHFVYPDGQPCRLKRDLWRMKGIVKQLKKDGVELYHGLTGELPLGLKKSGVKSVVTIHDLIFMRHPEYYHWIDTLIYRWKFFKTCKEADRIIAISERTKADIIELGGVDPDKIDVIYQSCNPMFSAPVSEELKREARERHSLPQRFLLCVGTIERRKNTMLALRALTRMPQDVHLVLIGRHTPYVEELKREAKRLELTSRLHLLKDISNDELTAIMQMAEVFVYPSRYEGFGIPIIEAIFARVRVVACTGSCLEEAGGDHCLYVEPDDVEGMAEAVNTLLDETKEQREERIGKCLDYVQRFRGTDVASQVIDVYNKVLNRG